jgi:uncharacterized protein
MKHLESAFSGKNSFWRYVVMFGAVFVAINTIGGIPIIIAALSKAATDPGSITVMADNPADLSAFGIEPLPGLVMMLFPFLIGVITFAILLKPLHQRPFIHVINGRSQLRWNRFFVSGIIWTIISFAYLFIYKGLDPSNFPVNNISASLLWLVVISLTLIPFQASFEEIIFRGYLLQGFAVIFRNRWAPLILTSVFFGLMHSWNPEVKEFGFLAMLPQYIMFGFLFGITAVLDDGIEIALGAHTANNIFLSIMVTNSSSTLQTPAVFEQVEILPWVEFGGLVIACLIFLLVMGRIYNWRNPGLILSGVKKAALFSDSVD